jgi:hypothetical protein
MEPKVLKLKPILMDHCIWSLKIYLTIKVHCNNIIMYVCVCVY